MNKGQFVKWKGGQGKIVAEPNETERTIQLYRMVGDLYEPTDTLIDLKVTRMDVTPPLPTAAGLRSLWNALTRGFRFVERDVAIYAMLYAAADEVYDRGFYIQDYYTDGSQMYVICNSGADPIKTFRMAITLTGTEVEVGEPEEVSQSFAPVTRTTTQVFRNAKGERCWVSVASTATINRVNEIDSMALYDSFERYANETGDMPYLTVWHCDEKLQCGVSRFVHREGCLYLTGGVFDDTDFGNKVADGLERQPNKFGVSIGFLIDEDPEIESINGRDIPVFKKGRHIETSILPENAAASKMTSINVARGINNMSQKLLQTLTDLTGDPALAKTLTDSVEARNLEIVQSGTVVREAEPAVTPVATPVAEVPVATPGEIVIGADVISAIVAEFEKSPTIVGLREQLAAVKAMADATATRSVETQNLVTGLVVRLATVEQSEEQKLRAALNDAPPARVTTLVRASTANVPPATPPAKASAEAMATDILASKGFN